LHLPAPDQLSDRRITKQAEIVIVARNHHAVRIIGEVWSYNLPLVRSFGRAFETVQDHVIRHIGVGAALLEVEHGLRVILYFHDLPALDLDLLAVNFDLRRLFVSGAEYGNQYFVGHVLDLLDARRLADQEFRAGEEGRVKEAHLA
jgi:hypothetical protein